MIIRGLKDYKELKYCVKFACERYDSLLFPPDENYFFNSMKQFIKDGGIVKVIIVNDEIVSWGGIHISAPYLHTPEKEVSQMYYQTKLSGVLAVRSLRLYHESMVEHAKLHGIHKCTSSSIMGTQDTFYRILEKDGWVRSGCVMVHTQPISNCIQKLPKGVHRMTSRH